MTTFLLLHGGGHRAWHWSLLEPALRELGHEVVSPDLPMEEASAGASEWTDVAIEALAGRDGADVIAVGHSLSGLMLPVLADRYELRRLVFLSANVPVPGVPWSDYLEAHEDAVVVPWDRIDHDEDGRIVLSWEAARELYYPDCDESLAREAYEQLVPLALTSFTEPCPIDSWPAVPSSYIVCGEDQIIGPDWGRRVSLERLGGAAIELPGSHSSFLSRPDRLATTLDEVAALPAEPATV